MQQLWAPWRMELLAKEKPRGCIFCVLPAEARDRENLIVGRTERCFVILNKFPYNNGHLMVVPRSHTADLSALDAETFTDLHRLLARALDVMKEAYRPDGFNVGLNLGKVAGAGIPGHLHYHVVPRWDGDTNFMPVVGATKVMIESLAATVDKLTPLFAR